MRCDGGVDDAKEMQDVGCLIYVGSLNSLELSDITLKVEDGFAQAEKLAIRLRNIWRSAKGRLKSSEQEAMDNWAQVSRFPPQLNPQFVNPSLHFTSVICGGRVVPIYSLEDMLGVDKTEDLMKDTVFEGTNCMVLKEGRITCSAQMWLLKLQAYLS